MCGPNHDDRPWPQAGYQRLIQTSPLGVIGQGDINNEHELLGQLGPDTVMMMGDNPALPRMPERPTLLDFFRLRFSDLTVRKVANAVAAASAFAIGSARVRAIPLILKVDISPNCNRRCSWRSLPPWRPNADSSTWAGAT